MNSLEASADRVKSALDDYVTILSLHSDDPPQVMAKVGMLQDAIRSFVDTSVEISGWGNPFDTRAEEVDPSPDSGREQGNEVVRIDAHYVVRVTDASGLGRFVAQPSDGDMGYSVEQIDSPAAQINKIFAIDGWDPYKYEGKGLEVLEAKWAIAQSSTPSKP